MVKTHQPFEPDPASNPAIRSIVRRKARRLARGHEFADHEVEDLEQDMWLHLLQMRRHYDPSRGSPEAFTVTVTGSWAAMEVRQRKRNRRNPDFNKLSLDAPVHAGRGGSTPCGELLGPEALCRRTGCQEHDPFAAVEDADEAEVMLESASDNDREVIEHVARYGISGTARRWSLTSDKTVTRHRVSVMLARACARIEESQNFLSGHAQPLSQRHK